MRENKIKELLKNKKAMALAGVGLIAIVGLGTVGFMMANNKNNNTDNKSVAVEKNTENEDKEKASNEEKEAKDQLEALKKIDLSKLSEEDKKNIENKIIEIEKLIENKEYAKAKTDIEGLKKDINTKTEEIAKNEEVKEESKDETKEESKDENSEVASNTTNTSSNTSSNTRNSGSNSGSGSSSSSNQGSTQKPATPPVVEEKPVQPTPQPPVVEEPKPVYPSVEEVKQRLIAYGQSLGLKYDPSISDATEGVMMQGSEQMWSSERGNSPDQWIVTGLNSSGCYAFNVDVVDLGNGFCSMKAYGIMNWD